MSDEFLIHDFGGSAELLRHFQEKSEDIEKAVIPQVSPLGLSYMNQHVSNVPGVGMILYMIDGDRQMISREDAEILLNDGILSRMKVRIELKA
jgi:hypothetical protein